tara:strand:+ start:820 stop:1650 length:831 start_codon:yes stop_codon:yes gene_type:complete
MELGYGAPHFTPDVTEHDWGYGDEFTAGGARDTGYGSPYDAYRQIISLAVPQLKLPDDGGVAIEIYSDWSSIAPFYGRLGPFFVQARQGDTLYDMYGGWSGTPLECYTDIAQTAVTAHVPILAQGEYDLVVSWGQSPRVTITLVDALKIVPHNLASEVYSIRQRIPDFYALSHRLIRHEVGAVGFNRISALSRTIGQVVQRIYGYPETVLSAAFVPPATTLHVRSTLGFPDSGLLYVDGAPMTYSGKTDTSFLGVVSTLYQPSEVGSHVCWKQKTD